MGARRLLLSPRGREKDFDQSCHRILLAVAAQCRLRGTVVDARASGSPSSACVNFMAWAKDLLGHAAQSIFHRMSCSYAGCRLSIISTSEPPWPCRMYSYTGTGSAEDQPRESRSRLHKNPSGLQVRSPIRCAEVDAMNSQLPTNDQVLSKVTAKADSDVQACLKCRPAPVTRPPAAE